MKCTKVKNPCKICFQSVSNKNGLQCQGACRKWAHFKCLNYTPGKIQDIKTGVLKITCPCPDCNIGVPKEILTDPPYTCTNTQCPANKIPAVCSSEECPSHELYPQSCVPKKTCGPPISPCAPPKQPSTPSYSLPVSPCSNLRSPCPPPKSPCPPPKSPSAHHKHPPSSPPKYPPCSPPKYPPCSPPKYPPCSPPKYPPCVRSKSPPPSTPPVPTKKSSSSCPPVCPPSCPSWQRGRNAKKSFSPKQSQSCSNMSKESSSSGRQIDKMRPIYSDSKLTSAGVDPKMLFAAIESLCSTVGELSTQLRNLMCEMQTGYGS